MLSPLRGDLSAEGTVVHQVVSYPLFLHLVVPFLFSLLQVTEMTLPSQRDDSAHTGRRRFSKVPFRSSARLQSYA